MLLDQLFEAEVVIGAVVVDKALVGLAGFAVRRSLVEEEQTAQVQAGLLVAGQEGQPALPGAIFLQGVIVDGQRKAAVGGELGGGAIL